MKLTHSLFLNVLNHIILLNIDLGGLLFDVINQFDSYIQMLLTNSCFSIYYKIEISTITKDNLNIEYKDIVKRKK